MSDSQDNRGIEILMVEDDPDDRALTERGLARARLANRVTWKQTGEEALAYLRTAAAAGELPGLVLLDLNLPGMHGREVLAEMRRDPALTQMPVVVLTSSDSEADIDAAYSLHANCYVTKPVNLQQFLRVVEAIDEFWVQVVRLPGQRS